MILKITSFIYFSLFVTVYAGSYKQDLCLKNDHLNITDQCQTRIRIEVVECMQKRIKERENEEDVHHYGDMGKRFKCCSTWDIVNCILDSIKVNNYDGILE